MRKIFLFCAWVSSFLFLPLVIDLSFAQDTLWQTDWYMGAGQLSISGEWNYRYYTADNLNTENHYDI